MSKAQKVILALTGLNLLLILLFPPFDDYSVTSNDVAIFGGFRFFLYAPPNSAINLSFQFLELIVVLINTAIFWLITLENKVRQPNKQFSYRKATLLIVSANLVAILLFPPFEYVSNMARGAFPTFEGFYFLFSHPPGRMIVTPILWLETIFVLINGGLLLLAFRPSPGPQNDGNAGAKD